MPKILLIEDMPAVRSAIASMLKKAGHEVTEASDGIDGLSKTNAEVFDLVITDIMMPTSDGTDVIATLKSRPSSPPIIAMSGGGAGIPAETALAIATQLADHSLTKPFENDELLSAVDSLL